MFFVVAPLIVLVFYAFTNGQGQFTLENLTGFFTSPHTMGTLVYSLAVAFVTTVVCLLLAYPTADILARSGIGALDLIDKDVVVGPDARLIGTPDAQLVVRKGSIIE